MVIAINDTLLESIKKELLVTLNSAESRVVDMFEFGETHGSDETLGLLRSAKSTLIMIDEQGAAALCDAILTTIEQALADNVIEENSELADSFLTLSQYIQRLSIEGAQAQDDSLKAQLLEEAKRTLTGEVATATEAEQSYSLSDRQQLALEKVRQFLQALSSASNKDSKTFWQGMYKAAKASKPYIQTRENYEYIWLLEQLAILNIKETKSTEQHAQQELYAAFLNYLDLLLADGETLSNYQNSGEDSVGMLKQLIGGADVIRNDYNPPISSLQHSNSDDLSLSIVFPVSAETIEAIAFLVKKELATTKNLFEKGLQDDALNSAVVREQLLRSFSATQASFKLLGFATGLALVEEAKAYIKQADGANADDWAQSFAECVILLEDALWELDHLDGGNIINPYDALHQQTEHTTQMAVVAAKFITAQNGHEFFRSARDRLIESFTDTTQLDLMRDAKSIHDLYAAMLLFSEDTLSEQLKKTEQAQLYLINKPEMLADSTHASIYLDVLVGYEIIFEQLRHSKTVDNRALTLLVSELQKFLSTIHFNIEQMATADYAIAYRGSTEDEGLLDAFDSFSAEDLQELGELSPSEEKEEQADEAEDAAVSADDSGFDFDGMPDSLVAALKQAVINEEIQSVSADEMDEEILEIFLEEAQGIATQLDKDIHRLRGNYFDEALVADIRRAFHTLKGSGRMVGLNVFGEYAWQHEELFNKAVSGELQFNDISQIWLEKSQILVADTVNSEPFSENQKALSQAAAYAEAVRKALLNNELSESVGSSNVAADAAELSNADIDVLAQRLAERQDQSQEMLGDIATHPALSGGTAPSSEAADSLQQIAQVSSLLNSLEDTKYDDLNAVFSALNGIKSSALNSAQQSIVTQLSEIAEQSQKHSGSPLDKKHIQQINGAIEAMADDSLATKLPSLTEGLKSIRDELADKASEIDLAIDDLSWIIDYVQNSRALFTDWTEEGFQKESVFNGLYQNSITLEQMLLNSRLDNPIAISSKLRQVLDEISRRRIAKDGLKKDIALPVGLGLDEVLRLLTAMRDGKNTEMPSADILMALDRALTEVQSRYETYNQISAGEGASMGRGMVNMARHIEGQRQAEEEVAEEDAIEETPLSQYIAAASDVIKSAKADFLNWKKADYDDKEALRGLRENVKVLRDGAHEVNHLDSRFVTQAIYDTLGNIHRSEKIPTDNEAIAIKYAIDELVRIHDEIRDGEIGEANPLILNNLADASNSILGFSPSEAPETPVPGVSSTLETSISLSDDDKEAIATAYLGQVGNLQEQIEAAKRDFVPSNFIAGTVQHNELIDSLYDVEASLDEQSSPTWAWEMLSNLEGAITNMQAKSLFPSPDDYHAISEALDAIGNNNEVDAAAAKKINNSLMGIRAGLNARQQVKAVASKFATEAKQELDSTDESFETWKGTGFTPNDDLLDLIGNIDDVDVKAEKLEYDEASELSSLINTVLKRLQQENLIPYEMVSETVEQAISEITAVMPQVHGGDLASPELRDMLDEHAIVTSVGVKYVPLNSSDDLDDEEIVSADSVDEVVTKVIEKTQIQTVSDTVSSDAGDSTVERGAVSSSLPTSSDASHDKAISDSEVNTEMSQTASDSINVQSGVALDSDASGRTVESGVASSSSLLASSGGSHDKAISDSEINTEISQTASDSTDVQSGMALDSDAISGEWLAESDVNKQEFATNAISHVKESRGHFSDWESTGFTDGMPLERLSGSFDNISRISSTHRYKDAYDLASTVSEVLSRVQNEVVVPSDETAKSVSDAIDEFDTTTQAIQRNDSRQGAQSVSASLLEKMRGIAAMSSLGTPLAEVAEAQIAENTVEVGAMADLSPSELKDKITDSTVTETAMSSMPTVDEVDINGAEVVDDGVSSDSPAEVAAPAVSSENNARRSEWQAEKTINKQRFATDATPYVDQSRSHFDEWEGTGFADSESLERLSSSFENISRVSSEHHFKDAYDLAETVADVLSRVKAEVSVPSAETTQSVSDAIDEFGATTQAIHHNDLRQGAQSINSSLLEKMRAIAALPSLGTPLSLESGDYQPVSLEGEVAVAAVAPSLEGLGQSIGGENTLPILQQFALDAEPHVEASKSHFADWEKSNFLENRPRHQLSSSVKEITDLSEKHDLEGAAQLGHAVEEVLERVAAEGLKPSEAVTAQLDTALSEFDRATQAIKHDKQGKSVNAEVVASTQAVASAALHTLGQPKHLHQRQGDTPADTSVSLSGELGEGVQSGVASVNVGATADAVPQPLEGAETQSFYQQYVQEAQPKIDASQQSFENWKSSDFALDEPLEQLSDNIKDIAEISERNDFNSGARLGRSVSDMLNRVGIAGVKPSIETTQQVESALNEFSRSAQAISENAAYQDIREEVITQIARVSSMIDDGVSTPLTSSVAAHEMFADSMSARSVSDSLQKELSDGLAAASSVGSGLSSAVNISEASSAADSSSVSAQLGMSGSSEATDSEQSKGVPYDGLKFNNPNELDETILDIFLDEARDIVSNNESSLRDWQADYDDLSALQEMQRGLHTLKGGARMAELTVLGDLSHNIETLLDHIVDGNINDKDKASELLSAGLQLTDNMVLSAENRQAVVESPDYYNALSAFLHNETNNISDLVAPQPRVTPSDEDTTGTEDDEQSTMATAKASSATRSPSKRAARGRSQRRSSYMLRVSSDLIESLTGLVGEELILRSRQERQLADHSFQIDELSRTVDRVSEQLRRLENETEAQILFRHDSNETFDEDFDPLELDRFSEIQQLSRLLAESMHDLQSIRSTLTDYVDETRQILIDQNNIQRELQDGVLSASLVRFDSVQPRIERLVEQVATELGKEVEVQIYGGQHDIERNMLEELIPGFEHTIRNSLAHGIEMPEEREKAGKPRAGRVRIGVRREGSEIGFVIADDGRGVNLDAIRQKARRLNILDESRAQDKDYLLQLLFEAGFSTQEQATQLSGRGIGMDVLKDVISARQGTIEIETEDNKGMATFIRMPFAMSITEALSVKVGQYRYAVPVMSVEGIARISYELYKPFELGQETYYTYGQNRYKLESLIDFMDPYAEKTISPQGIPALLVRVGSRRIAFEVEEIENRQEVIIKPVNPQFTSLPGIIGAAILDSGQAVPVMEASTLGRHFLSFQDTSGEIRDFIEPEMLSDTAELPRVLVVDDSITMRKVTTKILSKYDVEAQTAKDGLDAVDVISSWRPDVILLDIEMPRMDGFEFATHVRNDSVLADVPIIMITSRTGEKHRDRAKSIGVNDYLGKPYSEETLIASLQGVLGKSLKK